MKLSKYQIFMLLIPFIVSSIVYIYNKEIIQNAGYFFDNYEEYSNKTLDNKIDIYLKISPKKQVYQEIEEKTGLRSANAEWVAENVLYKKGEIQIKTALQKEDKIDPLILQAVFPKKKFAIINDKILYERSTINGMKIIRIENHRVLLKYKKGLKWISLFQ